MPRDFLFTKEEVVKAALDLTREKGFAAVSARSLGEKLGTSSRPVFSHFGNMEEVRQAIIEAGKRPLPDLQEGRNGKRQIRAI